MYSDKAIEKLIKGLCCECCPGELRFGFKDNCLKGSNITNACTACWQQALTTEPEEVD